MYKKDSIIQGTLLNAIAVVLLWIPFPLAFAETHQHQVPEPGAIVLQTQGVDIYIPLDLNVIAKTTVFHLAASFAAMLPEMMAYSGYPPGRDLSRKMKRQLGWMLNGLNKLYYYSLFRTWVAENAYFMPEMTETAPPAPVSSITSQPPQPPGVHSTINLIPSFHFEKNLAGGLSALLAYLAEFSDPTLILNRTHTRFDNVASFSVHENDAEHIRLSATLLDAQNTTHHYRLGRHKDMFWIEQLNQQDMTQHMRVAWSIAHPEKQAARLSVQLLTTPLSPANAGQPLKLNIPLWITRHMLASGTTEMLSSFSRLVLNWQLPQKLSGRYSAKVKAGNRALNHRLNTKWLEKDTAPRSEANPLAQPATFVLSAHGKSVPMYSNGKKSSDAPNPPSGSPHKDSPPGRGGDEQGEDRHPDDNNSDDHNDGNGSDSKRAAPANARQEERSLLWQATEALYSHGSGEIPLDEAYRLVIGLSAAGLVQILPRDNVETSLWPLVMSQTLADFMKQYLGTGESIVGDPDANSEYVVHVSPAAFEEIIKHNEKVTKLIVARKKLYSAIDRALKKHCGASGYCYFGGEQVRRLVEANHYGYKPLFQGNLPVSLDVDVLLSHTRAQDFWQCIVDELKHQSLTDFTPEADLRSHEMSFSFSDPRPDLLFNLYKMSFTSQDVEKKYLPGLDFAIANKDIAGTFLSPETIIYDSIKRGCGPTATCRSKQLDRLRLLNILFPSVSLFNDLRNQLMPLKQGETLTFSTSRNVDIDETHLILARKDKEIQELKKAANGKLNAAKTKIASLKEELVQSKKQQQGLNKQLSSAQKGLDLLRKELLEGQENDQASHPESEEMLSQLHKKWGSERKFFESEINKKQKELDKQSGKNDRQSRKNSELNTMLKKYKNQVSESSEKLTSKDEEIDTLRKSIAQLAVNNLRLLQNEDFNRKTFVAITLAFIALIAKHFFDYFNQPSPERCDELNFAYARNLCFGIKNLDHQMFEIIKTMDQLSEHHRVVKYQIYSKSNNNNLKRLATSSNPEALKQHITQNEDSLLLVPDGHTYWEEMNPYELYQIVVSIRQGVIRNHSKITMALPDFIKVTVAYCGLMPNIDLQKECTNRTADRVFTQRHRRELEAINIEEPDLPPGKRFIAFLPIWDLTKKYMTWHDIWPYRLDDSGYHLLGNSTKKGDFDINCREIDSEAHFRVFTDMHWISEGLHACPNTHFNIKFASRDAVFWFSYEKSKTPVNFATSYDGNGKFKGAWEVSKNEKKPATNSSDKFIDRKSGVWE